MLMSILRYELKRIRLNRLFPVMLLICCVYAVIWMLQNGIAGIGGTAPFSEWTYLAYCGAMLPPSILTLLFLQANYCSKKQQKADILPLSSPCTAGMLMLIRLAALTCCFLVLFLLEFLVFALPSVIFFGQARVFGHLLYGLLHMLPAVIFSLALGALLGKLNGKLIYVLAAGLFVLGILQTAAPYDLFGCRFFSEYPLTLTPGADGEPAFRAQPLWLCSRFAYLAAGAVLTAAGVCRSRKPKLDRAEAAV